MRSGNLLLTLISFLLALVLTISGIFTLLFPWVPKFHRSLIYFLENSSLLLFLAGLGMVAIGGLILQTLYQMNRRTYYHIKMGGRSIEIDETVIEGYLERYWETLFPGKEVHSQVTFKKNSIYVNSELPSIPFGQQRELLTQIDQDLTEMFSSILDHHKEFQFSASFAEN